MAADTTQPSSWLDTLGGYISSAGKLFNAGTETYIAAQQRLDALKASQEDSVTTKNATTPQVVSGAPFNLPSWAIPAIVAAGVVLLIFVVRKMR